jgi:LDH2 family malate/lactate/ureidoglycolate dehydrogenase
MSFTNTSPISFPTRSRKVAMGTDPISVAAPAANGDSFVLDMAITTVALGKVEMAARRGETEVPQSWVADSNGRETRVGNTLTTTIATICRIRQLHWPAVAAAFYPLAGQRELVVTKGMDYR